MKWPIGILIDNFHLDFPEAIRKAAEIGVQGIQIGSIGKPGVGRLDIHMSAGKRKAYKDYVNRLGLEISALCGDIGGFKAPDVIEERVETTKRIIDLALDMGTRIVSSHIGPIPMEPAHPRYQMMLDACGRVAQYAESVGACYAIETGPETSGVLRNFLDDISSPGIGVNLDPANFVMITGEDPARAVRLLGKDIVHTHVKDGVMNHFIGTELAYGVVPDTENVKPGSRTQTPIGQGSVNWITYLNALQEVHYRGYLTIEREGGEDRESEIRLAYQTLKNFLDQRGLLL